MVKTVDNFSVFEAHLFEAPLQNGEYYLVTVINRIKDRGFKHFDSRTNYNSRNDIVTYYVIRSKEELAAAKDEITRLCMALNLRAYMTVFKTKADPEKFYAGYRYKLQRCIKHIQIQADSMKSRSDIFLSELVDRTESEDLCVVDVDDTAGPDDPKYVNISVCIGKQNILYTIPTKTGYHFVCKSFNPKRLLSKYKNIYINKTFFSGLLYCCYDSEERAE